MFNKLRLWFALFRLRFRGAVKPTGLTVVTLNDVAVRRNDARIIADWFAAAEAEGMDMSHEGIVQRLRTDFDQDTHVFEAPVWRDDISVFTPERAFETIHRSAY
jgi:hypothetical protein